MEGLINERCILIIKSLITKGVLTLRELKYICNVSERTISKDLDALEGLVKEYNLLLCRKPKLGIWIEGTQIDKEKLFVLASISNPKIPNTPKERQDYILLKLVQAFNYITMQELCDEIYISRGTLENDLDIIESIIIKSGLALKKTTNRGIKIIGDEKKLRTLIANFFSKISYVMPAKELVKHISSPRENELEYSFERDLFRLFSDINLSVLEDIIGEAADRLGYQFTDNAFTALLIHIAIAIKRIKNKSEVSLTEQVLLNLEATKEYEVAEFISNRLEKTFDINIPKTECGYITIHILGSKIHYNMINGEEDLLRVIQSNGSIEELCKVMIDKVSQILDVNLSTDIALLKGLSMHIRASLNRFSHDIPIKNPLLDSIKNSYRASFEAAVASSEIIRDKYQLTVDENEIAYIALHIEAAIERAKDSKLDKKKVIFVCSTGIGTSQLVSSKLKRIFKNLEIVDILSSFDLENKVFDNIDLIITTIPLALDFTPVIRVNPLLLEEDIDNIGKFMSKTKSISTAQENRNNLKEALNLIDNDLFFINKRFSSGHEAISEISRLMYKKGYVSEEYCDSVIDREKIASTSSGRIALPHGDINKVYKSCISICTLYKKINWDGSNRVDFIIMLAIKKNDLSKMQGIFDAIYDIMSDSKLINKIVNCKDKEELLKVFKAYE